MSETEQLRKEIDRLKQQLQSFEQNHIEKQIFEMANFGVAWFLADKSPVFANKILLDLLGVPQEEFTYNKLTKQLHPIDSIDTDFSINLSDGEYVCKLLQYQTQKEFIVSLQKNSTPQNFVLYIQDITERHRNQKKLTELNYEYLSLNEEYSSQNEELNSLLSDLNDKNELIRNEQEQFRKIVMHSPIPLVAIDELDRIALINKEFTRLYGYTGDDLANMSVWWSKLYPDDNYRAANQANWQKFIQEQAGSQKDLERIIRCKDGSTKPVRMGRVVLSDLYIVSVNDLSEIWASQQALEQSEKHYRTVFDALPTAVFVVQIEDTDYRIINTNKMHEEFSNTPIAQLQNKLISDVFPKDAALSFKNKYDLCFKNRQTLQYEEEIIYPDSSKHYFLTSLAPIFEETGKPYRIIVNTTEITQRKQIELALKQSEEQYKTIFVNSPLGIFHYDKSGVIIDCNQVFVDIIGSTADVLRGFNLLDRLRDKVLREAVVSSLTHGTADYEDYYQSVTANKSTPVRIILQAIRNHQDEIVGGVGIVEDISERKQIENQLLATQEQYAMALKGANDGLWDWNMETDEVYYSPRWKEMLGYEEHELKNHINTWRKLIHPKDADQAQEKLEKFATQMHERFEMEFRMRHKEGNWIWILSRGFLHQSSQPKSTKRMVGTHVDLSKLKESELERKKLEERYRTQYNNYPHPVYTWEYVGDSNFRLMEANTTCHTETNGMVAEIIGKTSNELWQNQPELIALINRVYDQQTVENIEGAYVFAGSNENRFVRATFCYVPDKYALIISEDITERRQARDELLKAKERAEESDRLKSAFLANMSHEIRTPMNGIMGFAQLLMSEDITNSQKKQYIEIINESSHQLLRIVNDIIDISKIEVGQMKVHPETFNLNDLLRDVFTFYKSMAVNKGINLYLNKQLPDHKAFIYTDATKLRQILDNLLSNALKFTHKGHIRLQYQIVDNQIKIQVADTGMGIPEQHLDEIFERFRQVDNSDQRQHGGTGLGLSICKGNAKLLGGSISVTSVPDQGSVFTVVMPYTPGENVIIEADEPKASTNRVLVVEDEEINYLFLEELLQKSGLKLIHARDGEEALKLYGEHNVSLILMDLKLPGMNGYEATRLIRNLDKDIPIIAQTAYAMSGDEEKALEAGCSDYLSKPIVREKLYEILRKYIHL